MDLFTYRSPPKVDPVYSPGAKAVLVLGDTFESLSALPKGCAQLVISSPPYNIGKEYEARKELDHYIDSLRPTLVELVRVLADGGSLCWQVGNYVEDSEIFPLDIFFYPLFKDLGLQLRNRVVRSCCGSPRGSITRSTWMPCGSPRSTRERPTSALARSMENRVEIPWARIPATFGSS